MQRKPLLQGTEHEDAVHVGIKTVAPIRCGRRACCLCARGPDGSARVSVDRITGAATWGYRRWQTLAQCPFGNLWLQSR
jgi:hypothetical protein